MKYATEMKIIADMTEMRNAGATYEQIGQRYGISKQAVHQRLHSQHFYREYKSSPVLAKKWPIVNEYMKNNDMTLSTFADKCGIKHSRLTSCLYGTGRFKVGEARQIASTVGNEFLNYF